MPFYKDLRYERNRRYAPRAVEHLQALRAQLRRDLPRRTHSDTLLLATWNVRDFDSNKFGQGPRLDESFHYIAEVVGAFDLVAMQEVNEDLAPFQRMMKLLGPSWDYISTDVTEGPSGNGERMVFLFDRRKILFRNIAGEIVRPQSGLIDGKQFARTPFAVAFQAGWFKFTLCTVHLYYGDTSGEGYDRRVKEIGSIAKFLAGRSEAIRERYGTGENFILLGDFNIVNPSDATMKALTDNGFTVPPELHESNLDQTKFYDQIAFMVRKGELQMGPDEKKNNGVLKYYESVFRDDEFPVYGDLMANTKLRDFHDSGKKKGKPRTAAEKATYYQKEWRTWQMSDHYPLWVELKIDFSDAYLKKVAAEVASPAVAPAVEAAAASPRVTGHRVASNGRAKTRAKVKK